LKRKISIFDQWAICKNNWSSGASGKPVHHEPSKASIAIGEVPARTVAAQGYGVFSWKEYESRIRGGPNSYSLRMGDAPNNSLLVHADVLLALNEGAEEKYKGPVKPKGVLIGQKGAAEGMIAVQFDEIAEEEVGGRIYANSVAVGALAGALGLDLQALKNALVELGVFGLRDRPGGQSSP
jgi:2-oxoglutarate/2-oxoacid ferredoxin oxidoreductase subunit alpha